MVTSGALIASIYAERGRWEATLHLADQAGRLLERQEPTAQTSSWPTAASAGTSPRMLPVGERVQVAPSQCGRPPVAPREDEPGVRDRWPYTGSSEPSSGRAAEVRRVRRPAWRPEEPFESR